MDNSLKIPSAKKLDKSIPVVEKYKKYVSQSQAFKYFPIAVARAKNARIWDADGNEYIDFLASAASYNIGHSNEEVVKAVKDHLDRFIHYCLYLYHEPVAEFSELLVNITPWSYDKKVIIGLSGGDANDTALKAALAYTRRPRIASFTYSYHGTTALDIAVGGSFDPELRSVIPFHNVYFLEFPDTYRCVNNIDDPEQCGEEYLSMAESFFKRYAGESFAALIIEPIQGDGGVLVPPENFMRGIRKITEEHGIVLIDDEVQTGMGRTGRLFAIEHFNVEPDLVVLGKALGGGMPVSAVVGRREIVESAPPQSFFATSAAHASSVAGAIAAVKYVLRNKLDEAAREKGKYLLKRLNELKDRYEVVGDVRGLGLMLGVDIVKDKKSKQPDRTLSLKIIWRAWEKGLIMMTYGKYGNVLRIAPPLTIPYEDLDRAVEIIDESIKEALEGKVPDEVVNYMTAWK
ncbi:MAG: aspartate aminotransferase family protein [Thermosphaera sp.]